MMQSTVLSAVLTMASLLCEWNAQLSWHIFLCAAISCFVFGSTVQEPSTL